MFLSLAIPSVLIFWINWWIWELIVLISGLISVNDQATCVLHQTIISFFMMAAHGFNQATSTLVGKKIGVKDTFGAQR
jgi:Na+-driven multidrug efflux pump